MFYQQCNKRQLKNLNLCLAYNLFAILRGMMKEKNNYNIIQIENFIEATRDAGYKSIISALAELVDNAFEATASTVLVR